MKPYIKISSKFTKNSYQNTLESKSKNENFDDYQNASFPILKKTRLKHPQNLLFGHFNVNLIGNKFETVQEIFQNTYDIFFVCETKLIPPSQTSSLVFPNIEISKRVKRT